MSMNAVFVQVEDDEIARLEADPDPAETLFANQALPTASFMNLATAMQEHSGQSDHWTSLRDFRACQNPCGSRSKRA